MANKKEKTFITSKEFMEKLNEPIPWHKEIYYKIYRLFSAIVEIPQEIKWFIQRGKNGYSQCDRWDLGSYLSDWLPKALRELKKDTHGCPTELYDEKIKDNECKKWEDILEIMAQGFESKQELREIEWENKCQREALEQKANKGLRLFLKWFDALWD